MEVQVLLSIMNQKDDSILKKMNIQTDIIVVNQCDKNMIEEFIYNSRTAKFIHSSDRGIGISRNTALMHSSKEICVFADDDEIFIDGYENIICDAFKEIPKADIIVFNVPSRNPDRPSPVINQKKRLRYYSVMKYGTFSVAIKASKVKQANIFFSLLFGGGAKFGCGEDSLFFCDAIRKGLKVYAHPAIIATVEQKESTWFKGYNKKYFQDKGALYAAMSKYFSKVICIIQLFRHRKRECLNFSSKEAYIFMCEGIRKYKSI